MRTAAFKLVRCAAACAACSEIPVAASKFTFVAIPFVVIP
jgi:hypothetical protein